VSIIGENETKLFCKALWGKSKKTEGRCWLGDSKWSWHLDIL